MMEDNKELLSKISKQYNITVGELEELISNLGSKYWRLNNLYMIKDKDGKSAIMRLNASQIKVLKQYRHNKKIILKSRQQGISTLYLAYNLDSCIFEAGFEAGIQSYGKAESEKLSIRAELMWDEFPQLIKDLLEIGIDKNNQTGMYFTNRSILKIGNFRGDTLQSLHVSELGKIAKKFPDKARELKTGAFQAVSSKNKITIESTAEGKSGLFYEMWQDAEKKRILGRPLTALDFQSIFLPWYNDPDCQLFTEVDMATKTLDYLKELSDKVDVEFTEYQIWWYQAKLTELKSDMQQEYPSTPEEAFMQSVEGMYYKDEFRNLKIVKDAYNPELVVNMAFDLGMNDAFSIGFSQQWEELDYQNYKEVKVRKTRIIGEYTNSDKGLDHYRDVVQALGTTLGWRYGVTYVPHDIAVRELIAGITRWQALIDRGFNPVLIPKHSIADGIQVTRDFLGVVEIDETCETILGCIQNYRKKKDDKLGVFLDSPVHDEWSHPADMLRYKAMGYKNSPPVIMYVAQLNYKRRKRKSFGFDV